jgi:hypothetical protein
MRPPTKTWADFKNDSELNSKARPNLFSPQSQDRAVWPILQLFGDSPMGLFSEVCDNNVPVTFILLRQDIPEFHVYIITDFLPYLVIKCQQHEFRFFYYYAI